jgi:hypothetical protein
MTFILIAIILVFAKCLPVVLAGRGHMPTYTPEDCNAGPLAVCTHGADPHGELCPAQWCDCEGAGKFPILSVADGADGADVCGYTSLNPSATIVVAAGNCKYSTTTLLSTVVVSPSPVGNLKAVVSNGQSTVLNRLRDGGSTQVKRTVALFPTSKPAESTFMSVGVGSKPRLHKQTGNVAYSNCDGPTPPASGYRAPRFPTMRSVLEAAFQDALTLAQYGYYRASQNSKGFTHYFGGNGADTQLAHFRSMMATISSATSYFSIRFECRPAPDICVRTSIMVTDATTGGPNDQKVCSTSQSLEGQAI